MRDAVVTANLMCEKPDLGDCFLGSTSYPSQCLRIPSTGGGSVENRIKVRAHDSERFVERVRNRQKRATGLARVARLPQLAVRHIEVSREADASSFRFRLQGRPLEFSVH